MSLCGLVRSSGSVLWKFPLVVIHELLPRQHVVGFVAWRFLGYIRAEEASLKRNALRSIHFHCYPGDELRDTISWMEKVDWTLGVLSRWIVKSCALLRLVKISFIPSLFGGVFWLSNFSALFDLVMPHPNGLGTEIISHVKSWCLRGVRTKIFFHLHFAPILRSNSCFGKELVLL